MSEGDAPSEPGTAPPSAAEALAALDAWQATGAHRFDPVRFRFLQVLARRTASHPTATRRVLEARLAEHVRAYAQALALAGGTAAPAPERAPGASRGPLGRLVDRVVETEVAAGNERAIEGVGTGRSRSDELKAVSRFRDTWARLEARRRLAQSRSRVPENAGPLHSHHLVHRALSLMQALSPGYLQQFMSYVDTLASLERLRVAPGGDGAHRVGERGQSAGGAGTRTDGAPKPRNRRSGKGPTG